MRGFELHGFCRGVYLSDIGSVHMVEKFTTEDKFLKRLFKECLRSQWSARGYFLGVICVDSQHREKEMLEKIGAKFHKFNDSYECVIFTFSKKDLTDFIRNRNADLLRRFASNQLHPLEINHSWIGIANLPLFCVEQAQNGINNQEPIRVGDRVRVGEGIVTFVVLNVTYDRAIVRSESSGNIYNHYTERLRRI